MTAFEARRSSNIQETQWQGSIEDVNGVTAVKNPKEPMYGPEVFNHEGDLSIGAVDGSENQLFS